jgi:pimeloyl-ACP methyl ester carboxylesterase
MGEVRRDGVTIHYETAGEGAPLLLIAGLASDSASWGPIWAPLAERFRLIAPDNRGCGRTTPQDAPITIAAMAEDALAVLDAEGVETAHVLGHSMGALIATALALRAPGRVERLVLAGASFAQSGRNRALLSDMAAMRAAGAPQELWFRMLFYWLFADRFFEDEAAIAEAARLSVAYPYPQSDAAFAAQVAAAGDFSPSPEDLQSLEAPVLALLGEADLLFPPTQARASFAAIQRLEVVELPGAGHSLHWDDPAGFVAAATRFLARG